MTPDRSDDTRLLELQGLEAEVISALAAHQRWREAMRVASDPATEVAPNVSPIEACPLTSWLEVRMPQKFRQLALYDRSMQEHVEFHRAIDMVVAREPEGLRAFARAAIVLKSSLDEWLTFSRKR